LDTQLRRIDIIKILMEYITDEAIISNIGFPSKELHYIKDRNENFYMLGSMGLCSSIGLGLALNTDKKVIAIDGDGSVLMNLGTLSTIGHTKPTNFILLIVDNSAYGSTGNQKTHTNNTELDKIAKSCGLHTIKTENEKELREALTKALKENKTTVIVAKAKAYNKKTPNIKIPPVVIKYRFMNSVNG